MDKRLERMQDIAQRRGDRAALSINAGLIEWHKRESAPVSRRPFERARVHRTALLDRINKGK